MVVMRAHITIAQTSLSLKDYKNALAAANAFDRKLETDAAVINTDYYPMLSLVAPQVFARIKITISKRANGSLNPDDTLAFLKADRTSAIVGIYSSAPFWLYQSHTVAVDVAADRQ